LCVLGWPAVVGSGQVTEIRGPRQVELLALLAAASGEVVRTEQIEDELWDGRPVSGSTLRVNVARLRGWLTDQLGHDPIRSSPLGYALELDGDETNAVRFAVAAESVAESRRQGRFATAVRLADDADRLWRGRAFEGAVDLPTVRAERERLESLRVDNWQERAISLIELGDFDRALDQIEAMQKVQPYRETAYGLQMIALHRAHRRPEAVRQYQQTVELFRDELGVGPGAALTDLSTEIVADVPGARVGEAYLRHVGPVVDRPRLPGALQGLVADPIGDAPFVGRDEVLGRLVAQVADPGSTGAIAVVEGVGGIGKSRLAAEVAGRAAARGMRVLYAACSRGGGVGTAPLPDLLSAALDLVAPDEVDEHTRSLQALVPAWRPALEPTDDAEVDAETRRLQMLTGAERLLDQVTTVPSLVVIDDIQWIEPSGLRFLSHLVDRLPAVRWLFLARPTDRTDAAVALLGDLGRRYAEWHELSPLTTPDVRLLIDAVAPPGERAAWHEMVAPRSGGSPFVATALLRHLSAGGDPLRLPRGVEHVVLADVARLGQTAQAVVELLAVAGGPVASGPLARAVGATGSRMEAIRHELEVGGLAEERAAAGPDTEDGWHLAHDLVGEALLRHLGPDRIAALHASLGRALAGSVGAEVERLRHLLDGGSLVTTEELDAVAADALRALNLQTSFEAALELGDAYLARVGDDATSPGALDARVQVATALLATGDTRRGLAVHDVLLSAVRDVDDARLLTDLVLARGPVDTGGADPVARGREACHLLDLLPPEERSRRVQLACWAAHNLLVAGEPRDARQLIEAAREEADGPVLHGLVAGVTYQAATSVDADPADAARAYAELERLAVESGLVSTIATHRLFALDQAMREGDLGSLRTAIDALAAATAEFPRPDLRWWVLAAEAGYALAAGDLRAADRGLMRAMEVGRELSVAPSGPVSLLQRLVVQWEAGQLAALHPVLGQPPRPEASVTELCMSALVCMEADDLVGAERAGRVLVDREHMLIESGPSWPAFATITARLALVTDLPELAAQVEASLQPHAGHGLSCTGLVHFGSADRLLGLTRAAQGDLDGALERLEATCEALDERGLITWAARAAADVAEVHRRRGGPGSGAAEHRYRARATGLRSRIVLPGT
jgi:DNA-binding SARP family transcriptional activator